MTTRTVFLALVTAAVCVPAAANAIASAELYNTKPYFYGRFDARIRYAPGDGVVSTFFLWKEGSEAANAYWNELDYEKVAADCHMQLNSIYGNPETQHQSTPSLGFAMCEGYHDYRIEWTPTYIAWIVDGKEIRRDTGANATAYAQNATGGMTFHFNIWPGDSGFGGNINNTKLPVHQYISYVQYWSYDNGSFKSEWREEFQGSGVPSGWAVGTWESPYKLSTHNAQNVSFKDGIAVLSLTADGATGFSGTPPADPLATGTGGTSGSGGSPGTGGVVSTGGSSGSGGTPGTGGSAATGGSSASGGSSATGGKTGAGGTSASGGGPGSGGTIGSGGTPGSGGTSVVPASGGSGGSAAGGAGGAQQGGAAAGGAPGSGGSAAGGAGGAQGGAAAGGAPGSGGVASGGTSGSGGDGYGGTAGPTASDGGCSCSTAPAASPLLPALGILFLVVLGFRRKEI